ncbi:MAG: sigma-70 family RNA polymerase sigma factor, partial [Dermatophilaceae bacterium]
MFWGQPNDRTLVDGHGTVTAIVDQRRHAGVGDDDATLLERLRAGDVEPYAELWRRHLASAYRVAQRYRGRASAEDIVGEASLRVFDRIQAGDGPTSNFRGYFLTVVKSVALDLGKADLRLVPTDGQDLEASATPVPPYDATGRVDQDLVRVAFGRLSARDQQVLW